MKIKERIFKYLDYKSISPTKVEVSLSWGKGALLKAKSISADRLGELLLQFGDLSAEWLLRDKGEMLISEEADSSLYHGPTTEYQKLVSEIEELKTKVARLEGQNDLLREQLGLPERNKVKSA